MLLMVQGSNTEDNLQVEEHRIYMGIRDMPTIIFGLDTTQTLVWAFGFLVLLFTVVLGSDQGSTFYNIRGLLAVGWFALTPLFFRFLNTVENGFLQNYCKYLMKHKQGQRFAGSGEEKVW